MARDQTLPIRVNSSERSIIETMAQLEKLPVGTFVRRRLLFEAERRGILPLNIEKNNRASVEIARDLADAIAV